MRVCNVRRPEHLPLGPNAPKAKPLVGDRQGIDASRGLLPGMANTNKAPLPPLPSVKQAANYVGVDPKTVQRWISQGRLSAKRSGPRLIRLDRDEVLQLGRPVGAA
jgi:excisionase family DNA binding protein